MLRMWADGTSNLTVNDRPAFSIQTNKPEGRRLTTQPWHQASRGPRRSAAGRPTVDSGSAPSVGPGPAPPVGGIDLAAPPPAAAVLRMRGNMVRSRYSAPQHTMSRILHRELRRTRFHWSENTRTSGFCLFFYLRIVQRELLSFQRAHDVDHDSAEEKH